MFSFSDFCYGNEDLAFSISEAIKLCVTVVAYAPESFRRYENTLWIMHYSSIMFLLFCIYIFSITVLLSSLTVCMYLSSLQMLMVLEALVPCHLQKLKSNTVTMESASAARDEIAAIAALATSLQALLYSSEALTRSDSRHCNHKQKKLQNKCGIVHL